MLEFKHAYIRLQSIKISFVGILSSNRLFSWIYWENMDHYMQQCPEITFSRAYALYVNNAHLLNLGFDFVIKRKSQNKWKRSIYKKINRFIARLVVSCINNKISVPVLNWN